MIKDKKLKLERLHIKQQVNQALFETKRDMYTEEIDSMERQLEKAK